MPRSRRFRPESRRGRHTWSTESPPSTTGDCGIDDAHLRAIAALNLANARANPSANVEIVGTFLSTLLDDDGPARTGPRRPQNTE